MTSFTELGLPPALVSALAKQQIEEPTPIQIEAYPVLLAGKDAYLQAETGTGKTLAYLLPLFARIDPAVEGAQVVIVAPTHELAIQIQRQCCDLAQNAAWPIRSLLLIGGTSMDRQIEKLKRKPQVLVGSPGRVLDLIGLRKVKPHTFRSIVIDEADRLLAGESLQDLTDLLKASPRQRQLVFASATEQPETDAVLASIAPDVVRLRAAVTPVNANIEHLYLVCDERDKPELLRKLLHAIGPERAMVFVHRKETADIVTAKLRHHGIPVADLHGAFEKQDRKQAMDDFRSGRSPVLIASDLGARGLDIKGISHVINLDAPSKSKAYLHRVGRTARAGATGQAITLMTADETRLIRRYETELGIQLREMYLREGELRPLEP